MLALPYRVRKEIRIEPTAGLEPLAGARNREKHFLILFSIILDQSLNQEVHLIQIFKNNAIFKLVRSGRQRRKETEKGNE